jgi:2-(1,2-epoxy-1,2-dihydrophenyl)acetyl-CoA isomerase
VAATQFDVSDGIAVITLDRPERLNAIGDTMLPELHEHLRTVIDDGSIRALVLTGAGRGFCAGGDLADVSQAGGAGRELARDVEMREHLRITERLHGMPKVTIAAVNGAAAGAGMAWACACDIRVAATDAFFVTAFLRVGQTGDYGLSWTLPRLVGVGRARELFLLGRRVSADEALRIGLVSEVVPRGELRERALTIGAAIVTAPPLTVAAMKANLQDAERLPLGELLDAETERFGANLATEDAREAARAFVEKRAPAFRGR